MHVISEAEYLEQDRSPERLWGHEYWGGVVNERISCSFAHCMIVGQLTVLFRTLLRDTGWVALHSGLRVHIPAHRAIVYPDFMIIGPEPQFYDDMKDTLTNPRLIIEVASPETQAFDRGRKALAYMTLPSLTDYLTVSQDDVRVDHYKRRADGWSYSSHGPAASLKLTGENLSIPIEHIYSSIS